MLKKNICLTQWVEKYCTLFDVISLDMITNCPDLFYALGKLKSIFTNIYSKRITSENFEINWYKNILKIQSFIAIFIKGIKISEILNISFFLKILPMFFADILVFIIENNSAVKMGVLETRYQFQNSEQFWTSRY